MVSQTPAPLPTFDDECFLISPIGEEGSEIRNRADGVRDFIVRPALEQFGLAPVRADDIATPGQITLQVIEHVLSAKAAIADISGANANVFYELAVRHTAQRPVVLIAHEDDRNKLPFDIAQMRTIFYDHRDLKSAADCQAKIQSQLQEALERNAVDSPVVASVNLAHLQGGNPSEQVLAQLVSVVENLNADMGYVVKSLSELEGRRSERAAGEINRKAYRNLRTATRHLRELAAETEDPRLIEVWSQMRRSLIQVAETTQPETSLSVLRKMAVTRAVAVAPEDTDNSTGESDPAKDD
jgi:hypothetical protein